MPIELMVATHYNKSSMTKNKRMRNSIHHSGSNPRSRMLLILAGVLILAAAIAFATQGDGQETAGEIGPRLSVDQEVVDFGKVNAGQQVSAAFTLTNTGDETLRLTKEPVIEVKEGC
jgi:hypothetical protein